VVGGGGQRQGIVEVVQRQLEVGGADGDVGVLVVELVGAEAFQPNFFCRPARGGGHDLHQARGADVRARVHDEAAFLAHQAVDIGGVQPDLAGAAQHRVVKRHGKAL